MQKGMIILDLPEPPSVNVAYKNIPGKGRAKTAVYRNWETECLYAINRGKGKYVMGSYLVILFLSEKTRKDADNCIKPALDLLKKAGVTEDDVNCYAVQSTKSPDVQKGKCRIAIMERDNAYFPFIAFGEHAAAALRLNEVAS